jgi:soluble lytic murein transglycosylase-like protein
MVGGKQVMKYAAHIAVAFGIAAAYLLHRLDKQNSAGQGDEVFPQEIQDAAEAVIEGAKNMASGATAQLFGTKYDALIFASAQQAGIEPALLYKLLYQESHFREDIINGWKRSPAGAIGIAQFMPETAVQWCGSVDGAMNPNVAIPAAARYLAYLISYFGGNVQKGVAAYNWGMGNVQRKGLAMAPRETRQYVLNITGEEIAA